MEGESCQRLVAGAVWVQARLEQRERLAGELDRLEALHPSAALLFVPGGVAIRSGGRVVGAVGVGGPPPDVAAELATSAGERA